MVVAVSDNPCQRHRGQIVSARDTPSAGATATTASASGGSAAGEVHSLDRVEPRTRQLSDRGSSTLAGLRAGGVCDRSGAESSAGGRCEELLALGVEAIDKGVASVNSLEPLEAGAVNGRAWRDSRTGSFKCHADTAKARRRPRTGRSRRPRTCQSVRARRGRAARVCGARSRRTMDHRRPIRRPLDWAPDVSGALFGAIFCWASAIAPLSAWTCLPSASPIAFCTARVTAGSTFSASGCE